MATPTDKNQKLDNWIDQLGSNINEKSAGRRTSIQNDVCVFCNGPATEFKDVLSAKEFTISGICQSCQDEIFV